MAPGLKTSRASVERQRGAHTWRHARSPDTRRPARHAVASAHPSTSTRQYPAEPRVHLYEELCGGDDVIKRVVLGKQLAILVPVAPQLAAAPAGGGTRLVAQGEGWRWRNVVHSRGVGDAAGSRKPHREAVDGGKHVRGAHASSCLLAAPPRQLWPARMRSCSARRGSRPPDVRHGIHEPSVQQAEPRARELRVKAGAVGAVSLQQQRVGAI